MPEANLLIVEDDQVLARQLKLFFRAQGEYNIITAHSREGALDVMEGFTPQVALVDLGLPPFEDSPQSGLSLIPPLVQREAKVIVLTGQTSRKAAVQAIATGAFDYINKPAEPEVLEISVKRALFIREIEEEIEKKEGKRVALSRRVAGEGQGKGNAPLKDYDVSQGLNELKITFEREILERAIKATGFNVVRTAKLLKVSRESLYYLLKKHGIKREA